jgi:hypothetical protein
MSEHAIARRTLEQLLHHLRRETQGVLVEARARRYFRDKRSRVGSKRRRAQRRRENER